MKRSLVIIAMFVYANPLLAQYVVRYDAVLGKFIENGNTIWASDLPYDFSFTDYNSILYTPVVKVTSMRFKSIVPDGIKPYVALADMNRDIDLVLPKENLTTTSFAAFAAQQVENINSKIAAKNLERAAFDSKIESINAKVQLNNRNTQKILNAQEENALRDQVGLLNNRKRLVEIEIQELTNDLIFWNARVAQPSPPVYNTLNNFKREYNNLLVFAKVLTQLAKALSDNKDDVLKCRDLRDAAFHELRSLYHSTSNDPAELQENFFVTLNTCTALKESLSLQRASAVSVDSATQANIDNALLCSQDVESKRTDLTNRVGAFAKLFPSASETTFRKYRHTKDYALVSVKLVSNLNPKDTVLRQEIRILTKGGLDIDFSIGMVFNDIYKRSWYVDTVGTNTIREEKVFKGDFAWGGLINLSYRLGAWDRLGFSIGPAISMFDASMRYMAGVHYYHGRRDLLGISGGLCVGKTNFLPSTVSKDGEQPIPVLPTDIEDVTPYEKFSTGFYIGIFYNFSRL
jgi:hypothetical protein